MSGPLNDHRRHPTLIGHGIPSMAVLWIMFSSAHVHGVFPTISDDPKESVASQTPRDNNKDKAEDMPKSLDEISKKCERIEGLFTILRDHDTGEVYLLIGQDQLDKPFIYFTYIESGVARIGLFRGNFRDERVFRIERDYQRLRFTFEPTRSYFSPTSPLRFAADANVSPAVLAAETIVAWDNDKKMFLISANKLFLGEVFHQIKPSKGRNEQTDRGFQLGKLSRKKSRFTKIRNYSANTDLIVEYVYDDLAPKQRVRDDEGVADSRYISVKVQHSLVQAPRNGFQARRDDGRVGYFIRQIDDMTSTSATPYRDVIHRWHLWYLGIRTRI